MNKERVIYPFPAFVDQDLAKLALLVVITNPKIGGLLIKGPKGSGKSTLIRSIEEILPEIEIVADCPFRCNPRDPTNMCDNCKTRLIKGEKLPIKKVKMRIVNLPLSATEDRVVGTLDIEKALKEGLRALQPGILAEANQNVLYVDEINLLPDNLVDAILDAAALGWNYVEREGISVSHPSRFVLIGSMNPEEGELRPQLLDRLALSVDMEMIKDPSLRVEIIKRNIEFQNNPEKFREKYLADIEKIRKRIVEAREILDKVKLSDEQLYIIADMCIKLNVDGHRPDIIIGNTAKTIAALKGRLEVTMDDIRLAAYLALNHRTRQGGFLPPPLRKEIDEILQQSVAEVTKFFRR
ncbi:MAG: ATP-binding protein [Candidatus Njordarchaeia archaeon]